MKLKELERQRNFPCFEDVLEYYAVSNDCIYHNDGRVTIVFEYKLMDIEDEDFIEYKNIELLNFIDNCPYKSEINFYFSKIELLRMLNINSESDLSIINYLSDKRLFKYNNEKCLDTKNYITVTLNSTVKNDDNGKSVLNNLRSFYNKDFKFTAVYLDHINDQIKNVLDRLKSIVPGLKRLNSHNIISFLSRLLNHDQDDFSNNLNEMLMGDVYISDKEKNYYYNGYYHKVISLRNKNKPNTIIDDAQKYLFSSDIIYVPFCCVCSIQKTDLDEELKDLGLMERSLFAAESFKLMPGIGQGRPIKERMADIHTIRSHIFSQDRQQVYKMQYYLITWSKTLQGCKKNSDLIRGAALQSQLRLADEDYNLPSIFQSQFPGNSSKNKIYMRQLSYVAKCFLPTMSTPTIENNTKSKKKLFFHNRFNDIVAYDFFDTRTTNWNFLVIGPSGTGKSFTVNNLILQNMPFDPQLFIIDMGGSYKNIIENINGLYLDIDQSSNKDFSINFFQGPLYITDEGKTVINNAKLQVLTNVIQQMSCNTPDEIWPKEHIFELHNIIQKAYDEHDNNKDETLYLETFIPYMQTHSVLNRYVPNMQVFYAGIYKKLFKKSTIPNDLNYMAFDLAKIKNDNILLPIITLGVIGLILNNVMNEKIRHKRKLIIMDEAWSLLKGGSMASFVDEMYRTVRKYNGATGIITQGFGEIQNSPVGIGVLENTSYYYILGASEVFRDFVQTIDQMPSSAFDKIKSCKMVKGVYGEFYLHIRTGGDKFYSDILRLKPSKYDYWFSTTNADDVSKFNNVLKEKPDLKDALEFICENDN